MKRWASAVLAGFIALVPRAASAYRTQVAPNYDPSLRLASCQAYIEKLYRTNTGRLVQPGHGALLEWRTGPKWVMHLGAGFTNVSDRVVRVVDVRYTAYDPHGTRRAYYDATWTGAFKPGRRYDFVTNGFKTTPIPAVPIHSIVCSIAAVRFTPIAQGSKTSGWQRVAGAPPGTDADSAIAIRRNRP